jgi:hypothetical protein
MEMYWFVERSKEAPPAVRYEAWKRTMGMLWLSMSKAWRISGLFSTVAGVSAHILGKETLA